jgi:DNA-binding response OmpR family regulator/two-component sensor histidine kinase
LQSRSTLILNVDDREVARYAKTRSLRACGFEVVEAQNGSEALQKVAELKPAIVVLDVKLPDINGHEVCAVIKEKWPRIKVLQTSATYTTGDDRSRGLEGGADGYLIQPIEPRELVAAVRALLRLTDAEDELRRLNETLELRVQERTRELAAANERLTQEIGQRRKAESALVQAQKMEAIGHLTGGIAHDFNNLLTAVVGNLDQIRKRVSDPKIARLAERAFLAAERGSKLTAQLLAFSRTQKLSLQPVDLTQLFDGIEDLLQQSLGPTIDLVTTLAPHLPHVLADTNQLELAILNLAINSRDAMPSGTGRIVIDARSVTLDSYLNEIPPGQYVQITVKDDGSGMEPDVLAQAIDPFFTTKPAGKGTGLGLSQVYGIARQAGGTLLIESAVGKGTTVTMVLRLSTGLAAGPTVDAVSASQRNSETVLIVDDDEDVRALVQDFLNEIGYCTHVAANGEAALALLEEIRPDLVLADFAMPGSNGAEVARAMRQQLPDLPILFVSGHADTAAVEAAVGHAPLLRKPFLPGELAASIRSLLDSRPMR